MWAVRRAAICVVAAAMSLTGCNRSPQQASASINGAEAEQNPPASRMALVEAIAAAKRDAVNRANKADRKSAGGNGYRYKVDSASSKRGDFNGDSEADAALIVTTCETTNCHPTTSSSEVVLLRNNGGRFVQAFRLDVGTRPAITSLNAGRVVVTALQFGPDDPSCCPSEQHVYTVTVPKRGSITMREAVKARASTSDIDDNQKSPTARGDRAQESFVLSFDHLSPRDAETAVEFVRREPRGLRDGSLVDGTLNGPKLCVAEIPDTPAAYEYILIYQGGAGYLIFRFNGKLMVAPWATERDDSFVNVSPHWIARGQEVARINITGLKGAATAISPEFTASVGAGSPHGDILSYQSSNPLKCD